MQKTSEKNKHQKLRKLEYSDKTGLGEKLIESNEYLGWNFKFWWIWYLLRVTKLDVRKVLNELKEILAEWKQQKSELFWIYGVVKVNYWRSQLHVQ